MRTRLQSELRYLSKNMGRVTVCAVLCAMAGVLLWVHGSSAPWVYKATVMPVFAPGFTLCFLLWLTLYGLSGLLLGVLLLPPFFRTGEGFVCCGTAVLSFTLLLAWYPLFFSVLHSLLAAPVLVFAVVLDVRLLLRLRRCLAVPSVLLVLLIGMEIYFIAVTIGYVLLN